MSKYKKRSKITNNVSIDTGNPFDYYPEKDMLVVDRSYADAFFSALGCVSAGKWDADVTAIRLKRASSFMAEDVDVGEFKGLLDSLEKLGRSGTVILRSTSKQRGEPISMFDRPLIYHKGQPGKRARKRGEVFSFEKCHIPVGAILKLKRDPTITCRVVGDPWLVDFEDGTADSFTSRTRQLLGVKESTWLSPMHYWTYNDQLLRKYYKRYQKGDSE